jgi:death on curing protein
MGVELNIFHIEQITFRMAREMLSFDEPIPDFSTRPPNILESCLAAPFQTHAKKYLYPTFIKRVSMLFYLMIKNHPFINGNKRVAMVTLLVFLYVNDQWLVVGGDEFYKFTIRIAENPAEDKNRMLKEIEKFIKSHLKKR